MFLTNVFNFTHKCKHIHVYPNTATAYCPDCGKLIKNEWYISRCACCGVKLKTINQNGKILPEYHYCANCGSEEFTVEKIESINFIDINFAALKKVVLENDMDLQTRIVSWQEKTSEQPKLLELYQ